MLRVILCVLMHLCPGLSPTQIAPAYKNPPKQEIQMEPFSGRWITSREKKEDKKTRRYQLVLAFKGSELTFYTMEDGKKGNQFTLTVLEVEQVDGSPRFILGYGEGNRYPIHFDFEGDRMILVGRMLNRPFEGFSLSGEYHRSGQPK